MHFTEQETIFAYVHLISDLYSEYIKKFITQ